jgi:hypothetical protein
MKTHLTLKSFSNLSVDEIAGGISNEQPPIPSASFAQTVGPERIDAQGRQSDAPPIPSWNHGGLNE